MKIIKLESKKIVTEISKIRKRQETYTNKIDKKVESIIEKVKSKGDSSLFSFTKKFDNISINKSNIRVIKKEIENSYKQVHPNVRSAIRKSISRVKDYQKRKLPKSYKYKDKIGNILGWKVNPINRIGIYVPGGTASYPSSLIMTAVLAKVAGSKELVVATPPSKDGINPTILYTAKVLGINEILQIGGAQAIASLAYGTQSVRKVDKIVGPGNIYVATAKKKVFGKVDIDMVAGPSEVLIISDTIGNPRYIAADLIAQAEHDQEATAICLTTSLKLAKMISDEVESQLVYLPRKRIIMHSLKRNGRIFVLKSLNDCVSFSNLYAPEHLEIFVKDSNLIEKKILNAGSVFVGENSAEAFGDYIAGPSHVLPTAGSAIFSSPLSVLDFIKYSSYTKISKAGALSLGRDVISMATEEGLEGHANSVKVRIQKGERNEK